LDASGAPVASVYVVASDQRVTRHPAARSRVRSEWIATAPDAGVETCVVVAMVVSSRLEKR
jgi:hypothetical protein